MRYLKGSALLWVGLIFGIMATAAVAQLVQSPSQINGCVYNSSPPTLSNLQQSQFQCDSSGKLLLH